MNYVRDVMNAEAPLFSPYIVRRDARLLLVVPPAERGAPVRTIELDALQLARMMADAHEALAAAIMSDHRQ